MPEDQRPASAHLAFETAGEHVLTIVPRASPTSLVEEIRVSLREARYDSMTHVAILDGARLAGVITIENLFAAPKGSVVQEVMDPNPPFVAPDTDQEVAAWQVIRHGESALAVVDEEGNFVGFVPPYRLLSVLLWEHEEDMYRIGGFLRRTSEARGASQEPAARRFRHRVPWHLVGLVGALLSADLVGAFEEQLEDVLVLAFFIPGIVYLADAVGTQTETVVIRGLSVGVSLKQMARPELFSGLLTGLALSSVFFPSRCGAGVMAKWRSSSRSLCWQHGSVATLIAMALPWTIRCFGKDPAFGSGPLATVIQDLLSILIYFAIASSVLG